MGPLASCPALRWIARPAPSIRPNSAQAMRLLLLPPTAISGLTRGRDAAESAAESPPQVLQAERRPGHSCADVRAPVLSVNSPRARVGRVAPAAHPTSSATGSLPCVPEETREISYPGTGIKTASLERSRDQGCCSVGPGGDQPCVCASVFASLTFVCCCLRVWAVHKIDFVTTTSEILDPRKQIKLSLARPLTRPSLTPAPTTSPWHPSLLSLTCSLR